MTVGYNNLWKRMIDNSITKTELIRLTGISTNVMAKMGKNEPVRLEALAKICTYFGCKLDDIIDLQTDSAGKVV